LAQIEAGAGNPSVLLLAAIAEALGVATAELLPNGGEAGQVLGELTEILRRIPPEEHAAIRVMLERTLENNAGLRRARRIALVGLRGAGKSTLGAALAKRFGAPFVELNGVIEQEYGGSLNTLVELLGQVSFRRYERAALERVIGERDFVVIAAAGGVVASPETYERLLGAAHVIWLQASPQDHMARVMAQGDLRPMAKNPAAMADLKSILSARAPAYERAHAKLQTSGKSVRQCVDQLANVASGLIGLSRVP
jgi:XRE family aerobic/anaerobic benzoate catabolism transcriptional regulator